MSTLDDYLEHFGVKGMKWGVRRSGRGRSARGETDEGGQRRKPSSDSKKTSALTTRAPDQLTTKQLQAVNKRLELERNYSRLNPTKGEILRGKLMGLLGALETANRTYNAINGPIGKTFQAQGRKAMGSKIPPPPPADPLPSPRPEDRKG